MLQVAKVKSENLGSLDMHKAGIFPIFGIILLLILSPLTSTSFAQGNSILVPGQNNNHQEPQFIPGRYIVVLEDDVSPQDIIKTHNVVPDHVYTSAINGFAGPISPQTLENLNNDPRVKYIEQDQKMVAFAQTIPTGIDRIDAEPSDLSNLGSAVTIAIIDTGIDLNHPDLNVVNHVDCSGGSPFKSKCSTGSGVGDDDNGHGTHVAGTAAAVNNGIGVVGVAPGADLWAVKVLNSQGSGYMSWIIAGIDYVTANNDVVDVANMSLGCECSSAPLDEAITNSVASGITFVVAAGNSAKDASTFSPANHPDVITVAALADSDGMCGGVGANTSYGPDDTLATFSNYGSDIEIAAPGVSIYSTLPGGYGTYSGTSMASPHVTGAAALILADNPTFNPSQVLSSLLNNSVPQAQVCAGEGDGGFSDSHGSEPLVYVGNSNTPIVDEVAPVISAIASSVTSDSATITWDTDEPAISRVDYGTDHTYSLTASGLDYVYHHSMTLTGLSSSTDYHFKVISNDPYNNSATSGDFHFTTTSPPTLSYISVTPPNPSILVGSSQQFTATGTYSDGSSKDISSDVDWSSSDALVASIDAAGDASGLSQGSTTISAILGGYSDSTSLDVMPIPAEIPMHIEQITHSVEMKGNGGNGKLSFTVTIADENENPVDTASVYVNLSVNGMLADSASGSTDSNGDVTFRVNKISSGNTYTLEVYDVIKSGYIYDNLANHSGNTDTAP